MSICRLCSASNSARQSITSISISTSIKVAISLAEDMGLLFQFRINSLRVPEGQEPPICGRAVRLYIPLHFEGAHQPVDDMHPYFMTLGKPVWRYDRFVCEFHKISATSQNVILIRRNLSIDTKPCNTYYRPLNGYRDLLNHGDNLLSG